MEPSSDIAAFRNALLSSKSIIILAGAGLSAGSGLPTYRNAGGLWRTYDATKLATVQAWKDNPSLVWQFHAERRANYLKAIPNAAHRALASLNDPSVLGRVAASLSESTSAPLFITQNIDALSVRALDGLSPEAKAVGEANLLEMHGNLFTTVCTSCGHVKISYDVPICFALAQEGVEKDIPIPDLPKCGGENWNGSNRYGRCGGLLRPDVVWFGEVPKHMGEIARKLNWCDMLLVIGTSSLVQPAAGFAKTVKTRGGRVAVFNMERTRGDEDADFLFLGPCEETVPAALGL